MNPTKTAKNAAKAAFGTFEDIVEETKPKAFIDEARNELFSFLDSPRLSGKPKDIAGADLAHARQAQNIAEMDISDQKDSEEKRQQIAQSLAKTKEAYKEAHNEARHEEQEFRKEIDELTQEVVSLAKASGVDTKLHLQNTPKVGKSDISFLSFIVRILRVKATESKSAKDLVTHRTQVRTTGMNAWVSGKQMKIHEQGTMTLQG